MKEKHIVFAKEVHHADLTKTIDLIHQLGFYVEVESLEDFYGSGNRVYILRAIEWRLV